MLPELQDAAQLPGWTAPMVFQEGRGSQFSASGQHLSWEDEGPGGPQAMSFQVGLRRMGSPLPEEEGRHQQQ